MKTILVPLDGSALAEQVLPYLSQLVQMLNARVRLLRVVSDAQGKRLVAGQAREMYPKVGSLAIQWQREQWAWTTLEQQAEWYLTHKAASLRAGGMEVDVAVELGDPAEQIVTIAEREQVALIAMATHGRSGMQRWTLGSVTDKVAHAATAPIFVVRNTAQPSPTPTFKHILLPLDGSDLARQALPLAVDLARNAHAELILLEAIAPSPEAAFEQRFVGQPLPNSERDSRILREQASQALAGLAAELQPDVPARAVVVAGQPAEMIIDQAYAHKIDLIVMATHGYSGLRRWALGSVADKVLHAATVPLVLVRAGKNEAAAR